MTEVVTEDQNVLFNKWFWDNDFIWKKNGILALYHIKSVADQLKMTPFKKNVKDNILYGLRLGKTFLAYQKSNSDKQIDKADLSKFRTSVYHKAP